MKKAFKFFALTAVLVSMFAFSSCKKTEKLIVGSWNITDVKDIPGTEEVTAEDLAIMKLITYTFNDDNTMTMGMMGIDIPGTYDIDDDILTITTVEEGDADTESFLIKSISKKEMVWGDPEGEPGTLVLTKK